MKRAIRSIASAILFVSLSAVGADRFAEPKLLSNRAKKRLRTYFVKEKKNVKHLISGESSVHLYLIIISRAKLFVFIIIYKMKEEIYTYDQITDDDGG